MLISEKSRPDGKQRKSKPRAVHLTLRIEKVIDGHDMAASQMAVLGRCNDCLLLGGPAHILLAEGARLVRDAVFVLEQNATSARDETRAKYR
jgi:hypothetical protein